MMSNTRMYGNSSRPAATAATRTSRIGAALAGTEIAFSARVGTRLTSSSELAANHAQRNAGDVHQPWPNCSIAASGPMTPTAPQGAGMPTKYCRV